MLASRAAVRAVSRPPLAEPTCGEDGVFDELLRFSRSFICRESGARVDATVTGPNGALGTASRPSLFSEVFPEYMVRPRTSTLPYPYS